MRKYLPLFFAILLALASCGGQPPPVEPTPTPTPAPSPAPTTRPTSTPAPTPMSTPEPEPDTQGPEIRVSLSSEYFSPDNDGVDDVLSIYMNALDDSEISHWGFEIHEPEEPYKIFREWSGGGDPPDVLEWDGTSESGELVQSASEYPYVFTVVDSYGNTTVSRGLIEIDILVIKDGDNLRVRVPSIMFASNSGTFAGLNRDNMGANDRILRRIAQILNKFTAYKIKVEGHTNPLARTNRERERELARDMPLSEQRARTVAEYLVNLGVAPERLSYYGIAGTRPLVPYRDREHWWKNRRVEFILIK